MNSGSFGYCTIKLANDLKFLTKTFTEQADLKQKTIPPIYFDRPNTFFWFDGTNYLPFQIKLGKEWFKQKIEMLWPIHNLTNLYLNIF